MSLTVLQAVTAINDAVTVANALAPLVQQALANGQTEITDEQVEAARLKLGERIDALDAMIAKSNGNTYGS